MRFAFLLLLLVLFLWDTDATRRKIKRKRKKKQPAKKQTASDEGSCPAGQTCSDKYHVDAIQRKRAFGAAVHADMFPAGLLCIPMAAMCWFISLCSLSTPHVGVKYGNAVLSIFTGILGGYCAYHAASTYPAVLPLLCIPMAAICWMISLFSCFNLLAIIRDQDGDPYSVCGYAVLSIFTGILGWYCAYHAVSTYPAVLPLLCIPMAAICWFISLSSCFNLFTLIGDPQCDPDPYSVCGYAVLSIFTGILGWYCACHAASSGYTLSCTLFIVYCCTMALLQPLLSNWDNRNGS